MPQPINILCSDFMPDSCTAQPGYEDLPSGGDFIPSGDQITIDPCRFSGTESIVKDDFGQDVTSYLKFTTDTVYGLDPKNFRFTIPDRYSPNTSLSAVAVKLVTDENGPHHEVVFFPGKRSI